MQKSKKRTKAKATQIPLAIYRVLAEQPMSFSLGLTPSTELLSIQGVECQLSIRPSYDDEKRRRELGGTLLALEFQAPENLDLVVAGRDGFELIDDYLSAITLVSNIPFGQTRLIQVARRTSDETDNCEFIQFLNFVSNHWAEAISGEAINAARKLLAHWDGLESGTRLRRAARRYRDAAGNSDDVSAFLDAYTGLEAIEPQLARSIGLTPGTEVVRGQCEHCNHEFTRKKTALVGVRAFVLNSENADNADPQRKADWKLMNKLRNQMTHGLEDENVLGRRPHDALICTMHYLHDAVSMLSHKATEPTEQFRLARGAKQFLLCGQYTAATWSDLSVWNEVIETSQFNWVLDPNHGMVPEISVRNTGISDLKVGPATLDEPLSFATINDVVSANAIFNPKD